MAAGLAEHVQAASPGPKDGIVWNTQVERQTIGGQEAHDRQIFGQPVGIALKERKGQVPVLPEDFAREGRGPPWACRKIRMSRTLVCVRQLRMMRSARSPLRPATSWSCSGVRSNTSRIAAPNR